ncbi:hypothetical protein INT45_008952 [Circinella minor]|uniref:Uncharacterized protein n=1 Tax=Circinella minor TaxID=1195481 RepID=A0A8H7VQA7_9FUNG|nr:hypothetical protein INT45_008952 [Circinella minor]
MTLVSIPPEELPVLENLITVRHKLSALKKDRESSPRSEEILPLYYDTEKQVETLASLRSGDIWDPEARPAVYVHLVTVERYLKQLTQMGIYTDTILVEIEERVADVESIINGGNTEVASSFLDLLKKKLLRSSKCLYVYHELNELLGAIRDISPELKPLHNELVAIRRELGGIASRPSGFTSNDIIPFQGKIRQIDKEFHEQYDNLAGRGVVEGLLEQLYEETHDLIASSENISVSLIPLADRLKDIKGQLERLAFTHRWTLRETDLYTFQLQLQEIEKLRDDGKFKDTEGNVAEGQTVINFLLRGCYRLITKMLSENVPVAEALMPVHNQLSTVRRCLIEVTKCGKPDSPRDLYPYQMKLASIDNMRVNGIFYDEDNNIPEGQAICTALLNECYDILHDLISALP